jgi:hypothetical protein
MAIAIIQPGKIGDIIICLPIAHYFHRRQEVIWPIHKSLAPMFEAAVDYVKFIPVDSYELGASMAAIEPYQPSRVLPLAFGFQGYQRLTRLWIESNKPFDEYKYQVAGVPFDQKNKLVIRRNQQREEALYEKLIQRDTYHVVMTNASDRSITVEPSPEEAPGDRVEITNQTDSVFDWLLILERASAYFMIDSCMVNLVSQMGFKAPGVRCWKPGYASERDYPILQDNWTDFRESAASGVARIGCFETVSCSER